MPEPISPEALKPGEARTIAGEFRSGEEAQKEFEATSMQGEEVGRSSLDEPTPVAVHARRETLISRFLQKLSRRFQ